MTSTTVRARPAWNRDAVRRLLREISAALAGQVDDRFHVVEPIETVVGLTFLRLVQERFVELGRGHEYNGETWADNKPATIARKLKISMREARQAVRGVDYEVGRDTSLMFRSLAPGIGGHSGDADQIFEARPGEITVGTNRPYAARFHRGSQHQPARPLWPDPLPDAWMQKLLVAEAEALADAVALVITSADPPADYLPAAQPV